MFASKISNIAIRFLSDWLLGMLNCRWFCFSPLRRISSQLRCLQWAPYHNALLNVLAAGITASSRFSKDTNGSANGGTVPAQTAISSPRDRESWPRKSLYEGSKKVKKPEGISLITRFSCVLVQTCTKHRELYLLLPPLLKKVNWREPRVCLHVQVRPMMK